MSSKGKGQRAAEARRLERRRAQLASLQQRAAAQPAPEPRREHIEPAAIEGNEERYEPLLLAIESGLVEAYRERDGLPVDEEAERALRLLIARFEGDSSRRSGSPDVDAMADTVSHNVDAYFRRNALLSRAEIIGCLRRVITSVSSHHDPSNPRAYFDFVKEFIPDARVAQGTARTSSGLWIPGQTQPPDEEEHNTAPRRPSGLWVPGDR